MARSSRRAVTAAALLAVVVGCGGEEEPVAVFGERELTPTQFVDEVNYLLDDGQSLAEIGVDPETLLRRIVRMKLLVEMAEERVVALAPSDQGRLELFQESLIRRELLSERYPDPIVVEEPEIQARYQAEGTTTPLDLRRADIEAAIIEDRTRQRERDFESEMLDAAQFRPDTTTMVLVADRFGAHYDSLAGLGVDPASMSLPLFAVEEKARSFFTVFGNDFTVGTLVEELAVAPPQRWREGEETALLHELARRRALSIVFTALAQQRGLFQREDLAKLVTRKRDELMMNTLLRDVWSGTLPTDEEARAELSRRGIEEPSESDIAVIKDAMLQQERFNQMQDYMTHLEERYAVQYFPERAAAAIQAETP